jgi:hypothetical protein
MRYQTAAVIFVVGALLVVVVVAGVGGGGSRSLEEGAGAGEMGAMGPGIGSPVATVLGAIAGATAVILGANLTSRRQLQGVRMTLEGNRTLEEDVWVHPVKM